MAIILQALNYVVYLLYKCMAAYKSIAMYSITMTLYMYPMMYIHMYVDTILKITYIYTYMHRSQLHACGIYVHINICTLIQVIIIIMISSIRCQCHFNSNECTQLHTVSYSFSAV